MHYFNGLRAHVVEMLYRQMVEVQESVDAVGEAGLLRSVKLRVLDVAGHTLLPASLGQFMCL